METEILELLARNKESVTSAVVALLLGWNLLPQPGPSKRFVEMLARVLAAVIPSISYTSSATAEELKKVREDIAELKRILEERGDDATDQ